MKERETYLEQVRTFAGLFSENFKGDFSQASNGLKQLNEVIATNPELLPFLADGENQKTIGEIVEMVNSSTGSNPLALIPKIAQMGKRLKLKN